MLYPYLITTHFLNIGFFRIFGNRSLEHMPDIILKIIKSAPLSRIIVELLLWVVRVWHQNSLYPQIDCYRLIEFKYCCRKGCKSPNIWNFLKIKLQKRDLNLKIDINKNHLKHHKSSSVKFSSKMAILGSKSPRIY